MLINHELKNELAACCYSKKWQNSWPMDYAKEPGHTGSILFRKDKENGDGVYEGVSCLACLQTL